MLVGSIAQESMAEAQPAQSLDPDPTIPGGNSLLDQSGAAQPGEPPLALSQGSGLEDPVPTREQAQTQALSQKRPAKAAASALEEHQPQSPKRHRTSGKASFCIVASVQSLTCVCSPSLLKNMG